MAGNMAAAQNSWQTHKKDIEDLVEVYDARIAWTLDNMGTSGTSAMKEMILEPFQEKDVLEDTSALTGFFTESAWSSTRVLAFLRLFLYGISDNQTDIKTGGRGSPDIESGRW